MIRRERVVEGERDHSLVILPPAIDMDGDAIDE